MEPIRRERVDDRVVIRKQTDTFLDGITTTGYAELRLDKAHDILESAGASFTQNLAEFGDSTAVTQPNPYLTGALQALIPMSFSIADRDNNRLTLTMLVNPSNLNHGKTSSVYTDYTRNGYVSQVWGPNQDLITSTGKTAAFMVEGAGLTNIARRRSFSYANFLGLLYSYRNNGYQFLDPTDFKVALTRVINVIHGVELSYDNHLFMGHFNNFTIDEAAERPFLFDYNFEFVISSLSNTYDEIRGHFTPIAYRDPEPNPPRLLDEVNEDSEIRVPTEYNQDSGTLNPSTSPGIVGIGGF